jgi:TRAP-type transport system small permease protein
MIRAGKIISAVTLVLSWVSYAGVLAIMLLNVADVLLTKTASRPITGTYEITESLLLCTIMAAFAYAQSQKTHINMTIFVKHFPRVLKFSIYGLMGLISAGTAGAVGYAAILQTQSALEKGAVTSVLEIPMYPLYIVEAVAMFIFGIALLYDAALAFAALFRREYEDEVTASWS